MAGPPDRPPAEIAKRDDYVVPQGWADYDAQDHAIWRHLFERQSKLLPGRACGEYLRGLERLGMAADGIPDFERLSDILERATGWRIVAVPGLVPDKVFFRHLAARRFTRGRFPGDSTRRSGCGNSPRASVSRPSSAGRTGPTTFSSTTSIRRRLGRCPGIAMDGSDSGTSKRANAWRP